MFNVKIKVKEGNNTLPRTKRSTSTLNGGNGSSSSGTIVLNGRNSPATTSLRSSLASSNRSPSNSLKRKDKRVRIVTTTYMPTNELQYQQQQQLLLLQQQHEQQQQRLRQYGKLKDKEDGKERKKSMWKMGGKVSLSQTIYTCTFVTCVWLVNDPSKHFFYKLI